MPCSSRPLCSRTAADHARVRVPGVGDAEAGAEVDEAVAVDVPDVGARCALPEDRRVGVEAGDVARLDAREPLRQRARTRPGDRGREGGRERARSRHARHSNSCASARSRRYNARDGRSEPVSPLEHGVRLRAGRLALLGGTAVLAAKLAAWQLTGSTAVLSDALESVVNVVAGALLLYSLHLSSQPADRNHPYGHGKVEFFSAGVEGTLIAVAAVLIAIEAIRQLIRGVELRSLDLGLILVTLATAANAAIGLHLIRIGRRVHSLALVADGRHLLTDVATSGGVIIGLALVWVTGLSIIDPIVALIVAAQILRTGWQLSREAIGGLMDEAEPGFARRDGEVARNAARAVVDRHAQPALVAFRSGRSTSTCTWWCRATSTPIASTTSTNRSKRRCSPRRAGPAR